MIEDLEQKILDIGGARLLTQKSKVDGIKLHINLANDEITKAEVAKAKAEKHSAKLDASINTNKSRGGNGTREPERSIWGFDWFHDRATKPGRGGASGRRKLERGS